MQQALNRGRIQVGVPLEHERNHAGDDGRGSANGATHAVESATVVDEISSESGPVRLRIVGRHDFCSRGAGVDSQAAVEGGSDAACGPNLAGVALAAQPAGIPVDVSPTGSDGVTIWGDVVVGRGGVPNAS